MNQEVPLLRSSSVERPSEHASKRKAKGSRSRGWISGWCRAKAFCDEALCPCASGAESRSLGLDCSDSFDAAITIGSAGNNGSE